MAPLPVAPAGPPAIQSSKPQAPNTCTYSLKPKAWAPSWDGRKPARGARGAHARTYTRVPGTAHGCARQIYPASQRPGWLRAQRSATAAGRQRPGAGNLGSWAVHAARPALPALPLAAPPAPSRARAGAQATPRARETLPAVVVGPHFLVPRAPLFDATGPPAAKAGSPPRRARSSGGARRSRHGWSSCVGAGSAIPGGSGGKAEDAWVEGPLGKAGLGLARLPLASAQPGLGARPASTK